LTASFGIAGSNPAAPAFLTRLRAAEMDLRVLGPYLGASDGQDDYTGLRRLLLMPRDIMESEALLFEEAAFARNAPDLEVIVISATLSPRYVRALRARISHKIALIDAPFVGNSRLMETEKPSFLLGGEAKAIAKMQPVFDILGHSSAVMGHFGTAMAAKALQDCLAAASSAMSRSASDWAEAQGIEEAQLLELLQATFGKNMPCSRDPASLVTKALPGDNAGAVLVQHVEAALDTALAGVHLNPPRNFDQAFATIKSRLLH
jgi:3-hydroxyisobutyrate dehydrogenase-like beta-hydroxyacid dehydrogenase